MSLGDLERGVMNFLWHDIDRSWSVREVANEFPDHAYTTILTVLSRLASKGYVIEAKSGRANQYRAAAAREDVVAALMAEALDTAVDREMVLARFAESIGTKDRAFLARLVRRKK